MNDLELLEAHGPAATDLSEPALDRARQALLAEIAAEDAAAASAPRVVRRRLVAGLVAASAAGAALLAPSMLGLGTSGAVALAPFDPLSFPLTPSVVPAGLGDPVFEMDSDWQAARYAGADGDLLSVTVGVEDEDFWTVPDDARPVDVAGRPGELFDGRAFHGTPASVRALSLVWQSEDGTWSRVTGEGRYADAARVESFAESLRERPQPVDLSLSVAPEGWSVRAYKEDRWVLLRPVGGPADTDLTVGVVDEPVGDLAAAYGARDVTRVQVHGRDAEVGESPEGWVLLARTPEGRAYAVQAPGSLTREQVVEVAEGVTYTP